MEQVRVQVWTDIWRFLFDRAFKTLGYGEAQRTISGTRDSIHPEIENGILRSVFEDIEKGLRK